MNGQLVFVLFPIKMKNYPFTIRLNNLRNILAGGESFQQPWELRSFSGNLYAVFVVDVWNVTIDWLTVQRRLYSSLYPGPTLRVKAGDLVNLNLVSTFVLVFY